MAADASAGYRRHGNAASSLSIKPPPQMRRSVGRLARELFTIRPHDDDDYDASLPIFIATRLHAAGKKS